MDSNNVQYFPSILVLKGYQTDQYDWLTSCLGRNLQSLVSSG